MTIKKYTTQDRQYEVKLYTSATEVGSLTYLLMPLDIADDSINGWCEQYGTNIAIVTGMDWDNDLTPWPAPGVPKGSPDFKGLAPTFLHTLEDVIAPDVEKGLPVKERNLVGVSLSGLFALWAWLQDDFFGNIGVISGSFWYQGFVEWLYTTEIPHKTGSAFFELGTAEPRSRNRIFATVGTCTDSVIQRLREAGIKAQFQWVPGTHYAPIEPRILIALGAIKSEE